jgi:hypothetical protein
VKRRESTQQITIVRYDSGVGSLLIRAGIGLILIGAMVLLAERLGLRPGHLPGDIHIEGKRGGFYFPVVTCILISVILSALSWLFSRR